MSNIESVLTETRRFEPPASFANATVAGRAVYDAMIKNATDDWEGFWRHHAEAEIDWIKPFSTVYECGDAHAHKWFADGNLNISANCLDRHLAARGEQPAVIFESDEGKNNDVRTYRQLHSEVCRFANALKNAGVKRGDRVIVYMPMRPEAIVCMQACARIGAVHSVVFGGFSAKSLEDRIKDAAAKVVITADESMRGGKNIPLKKTVDEALAGGDHAVGTVIVFRRTGVGVHMQGGRDVWWHDAVADVSDDCPPAVMNAEDPLFILYTSGSTGKPKGIVHTTGGYLLGAILSMKWVFDYQPGDIYWCTADVGWITGHTYVAYGPLAVGGTQLIFEGVPTFPHSGRFWEIVQNHKVTTFYTAPTAIRSLIKAGMELPKDYDLSSLRILGTVGEPINPEAWIWYREVVGGSRCPIVDTWWQTETGCNMIAPLPGAITTKPGSCTLPLPGVFAAVVDEAGNETGAHEGGFLVVKKSWPSQLRTIWGDHDRYCSTYYPKEIADGKYYVAGDSANRDDDGYFWIMGRTDDVLNVSGHRLGTMEIESALVANPKVSEAAVVSRPDALTGEAVVAFVVLQGERPAGEEARALVVELRNWVGKEIGAIAKPAEIRFGDNLPKTRSGKIMRRLLRIIAKGEKITQDTSTLENPAILEQLGETVK
ncbi:acetate--CoA ligase [Candidatus Persebacteraceae bacterium Df01]|jgi:acetyl-CoA synthetase|uniref:Acetyl-coenzyme A synthetase n=1 Tax=Candidatus Doriopsillibacter californiensis TaxID=2970740 RepID=A0ABT7QKP1_9GAMM|nr:acetate--CoA ligase [Candidatus Persebacteraceae bacterium Df01]